MKPQFAQLYSTQKADRDSVFTKTDWVGCPRASKSTSGGRVLLGRAPSSIGRQPKEAQHCFPQTLASALSLVCRVRDWATTPILSAWA